jgi:polyisoprenoid-binding protein YceI
MSKKTLFGGVLAVVAVLGIVVWWFVFNGDAPDEVSVDAASAQLDEDLAAAAGDDSDDAVPDDAVPDDAVPDDAVPDDAVPDDVVPDDGDVNATWIIDDEIGSFDFETASGSFAGFRVDEELTVGAVVAVGRSGGVTGALTIEGGSLTAANIVVDMTTIISNDQRRESAIRRTIDASSFPTASFTLTQPVELPAGLADGETVTVAAVGDLTIAATTNEVTFTITAVLRADGFGIVTGSAGMVWQDFGITPPSAPVVVSIADEGVIEFQLIVTKG